MGFVPPKKLSWRLYTGSLHHVNIHLWYSAFKTNEKSQHQLSHNITMAVWWPVMVCLLIFALWNCNINKVCVLRWQWRAVYFKIETLLPGFAYPLATMPTVLWETLRFCITLHCVVHLGLIKLFLFGLTILHANNPLKNVSPEFVFLWESCALTFHSGYTSARFVRINWQLCQQSCML